EATLSPHKKCAPSPLVGEGWGGRIAPATRRGDPPSLALPHKGGGKDPGRGVRLREPIHFPARITRGRIMFGDYSIGDLGAIFAMQGFAGLILFSVYVLMALGLAIIFGQMGVINMAHGEFMILGAYVTWMTSNAFQSFLPALFP